MTALEGKLNNAQLEVLKVFNQNLSEDELQYLKQVLLRFRAELLMDKADRIWEEKGWTIEDVKTLLQTKMRTAYSRNT